MYVYRAQASIHCVRNAGLMQLESGNQIYLLVDESAKKSCSLCKDDQLKKDSSTGKGGYE
jgi:hypothetical protein